MEGYESNAGRLVDVWRRPRTDATPEGVRVLYHRGGGSIINISSAAASHAYPWVGYKTSKMAGSVAARAREVQ
ncbi:MAG: hypothetical protein Q8M79_11090 [Dehalococcoidia bacterium]|nr:hypothetical protein [Dehalococcoidia bacterium]